MTTEKSNPEELRRNIDWALAHIAAEFDDEDPTQPGYIAAQDSDDETAATIRMIQQVLPGWAPPTEISDEDLADTVARWAAELSLVSSTSRGATTSAVETNGRQWRATVTDRALLVRLFGDQAPRIIKMTVSDVPSAEGTTVHVRIPLPVPLADGVGLVAVLDYGSGITIRVRLNEADLTEAAAKAGLGRLDGEATVSGIDADSHPILQLEPVERSA